VVVVVMVLAVVVLVVVVAVVVVVVVLRSVLGFAPALGPFLWFCLSTLYPTRTLFTHILSQADCSSASMSRSGSMSLSVSDALSVSASESSIMSLLLTSRARATLLFLAFRALQSLFSAMFPASAGYRGACSDDGRARARVNSDMTPLSARGDGGGGA